MHYLEMCIQRHTWLQAIVTMASNVLLFWLNQPYIRQFVCLWHKRWAKHGEWSMSRIATLVSAKSVVIAVLFLLRGLFLLG